MAVSAVLSTALAACGGSDQKVSIDNLQKAADKAITAQTGPCPLGLDVDAALKKAGITATAALGNGPDPATAVVAGSATNATRESPFYLRGGAMITCSYTLSSGGSVSTTLVGLRNAQAMTVLAPQLSRDSELTMDVLATFIGQKFDAGKVMVAPGDRAAVVRLDASGGNAIMEVTTLGSDGYEKPGPILGEPLRKLTEALGKQVRV